MSRLLLGIGGVFLAFWLVGILLRIVNATLNTLLLLALVLLILSAVTRRR